MDQDATFQTSRTLPFAPSQVYGAFASAQLLAQWWGPAGFSNTFEVFEFRPGGRWNFVMHGPDGKNYVNESFFTALEPDAKVVIRHVCAPLFTLTVRMVPTEGGTRVEWVQVLDDVDVARAIRPIVGPANEQNLDRLERVLAAAAEPK